jgi:hypothetical protein
VSFFTRRRSFRTSGWRAGALRPVTSKLTTTFGALPSHPRAVERGTPRLVVMVTFPVRWTKAVVVAVLQTGRGRHGHDHRPFPQPLKLLEDYGERPPP